jgi:uncharacterized LabA/DUF88 family protein
MRAAIFIDGAYLIKQCQEAGIAPDYANLSTYFLKPITKNMPMDLLRIYFYYCAPWMSATPTEDEKRRMANHQRFENEIEGLSRWEFRLGKLEKRRDGDREFYEQKRVDVLMSVDLVRHTAAGHIQHAILVAGDSDFIPAVKAAKESGGTITLWCGDDKSAHRDLLKLVDEVQYIDWRKIPKTRRTPAKKKSQTTQSRGDGRGSNRSKSSTGKAAKGLLARLR